MIKTFGFTTVATLALMAAGNAAAAYVTLSGIDNNGNATVQVAPTNSSAAQASFLAGLTGVGTQTFESYAAGSNAAAISPISFGAAGNATIAGTGIVRSNVAGASNGAGRYSVAGGTRFYETDSGGNFEITFSNPIAAFGFFGIDIGDFAGTLQLQLFNAANVLISSQNVPSAALSVADGSILYFGILAGTAAEDFTRVRFASTAGSGDIFAFDNFTIGTRAQVVNVVPEPATMALLAFALVGLGLSRRRRA